MPLPFCLCLFVFASLPLPRLVLVVVYRVLMFGFVACRGAQGRSNVSHHVGYHVEYYLPPAHQLEGH